MKHLVWLLLIVSYKAEASCSTSGQMQYSGGKYQLCNGSNWMSMQGAVVSSCVAGDAGKQRYNAGTMQFCDGSNWYTMGDGGAASSPSASNCSPGTLTNGKCYFSATGSDASWTVPTGVSEITAKLWGAGGGGAKTVGCYSGAAGGAGGYITGDYTVAGGTSLTLRVGQGGNGLAGENGSQPGGFPGGGSGFSQSGGVGGGGGGGYSGIFNGGSTILVAGAGGAGANSCGGGGRVGGAGGGTTGSAGGGGSGGGTQSGGGTGVGGGENGATNGGSLAGGQGANSSYASAGAGAGFFGGGGGGWAPADGRGAGGGSSYCTTTDMANCSTTGGSGATAPNTGDADYVSGVAVGGASGTGAAGGDGKIVIDWSSSGGTPIASCTAGETGKQRLDSGDMQFCDGSNWYSMVPASALDTYSRLLLSLTSNGNDASSYGHTPTVSGNTSFDSNGANFDGSGDKIRYTHANAFDVAASTPFIIAFEMDVDETGPYGPFDTGCNPNGICMFTNGEPTQYNYWQPSVFGPNWSQSLSGMGFVTVEIGRTGASSAFVRTNGSTVASGTASGGFTANSDGLTIGSHDSGGTYPTYYEMQGKIRNFQFRVGTDLPLPNTIDLTGDASINTDVCTAYTLTTKWLGNAQNLSEDHKITFSGNGNGSFYSDSGCTTSATSLTISSGSNNGTIYYKNAMAETETVTATAASIWGGLSDNLAITVTAVPLVEIKMWGGGGGGGRGYDSGSDGYGAGGAGGYSYFSANIPSGTTLIVAVGGGGGGGNTSTASGGSYGGGSSVDYCGGGGGYSGVFISSKTQANALVIAGGGGGGGGWNEGSNTNIYGGGGGGSSGQAGNDIGSFTVGSGGTQVSGHAALQGENGPSAGGGGGGGYYGGKAGAYAGGGRYGPGGGGSGFAQANGAQTVGSVNITVNSSTLTAANYNTAGNSGDSDRGSAGNSGNGSPNATANPGSVGKVMIRVDGGSWTTYNHTGSDQNHNVP